jgi:cobalt/nickel transport system permease protein
MLTALKIRSIGKNKDKRSSASGVLGTIFIKAHKASEDTAKAMECRGFNGKYVVKKVTGIKPSDIIYIICLCAIAGVFEYLEVLI